MTIPEMLAKASLHGCNISITAIHNGSGVEIRLSKDKYTIMRQINGYEITQTEIDVIAYYLYAMISEVELGAVRQLSMTEENMKIKAKLNYATDLLALLNEQVGVDDSVYDCKKLISDWCEANEKIV